MAIKPTSSSQGSPRHDAQGKNEALALAMRNVLQAGIPQPTDSNANIWTIDDWNDEPLSPEEKRQFQDIIAKNAAKLSKAKASNNKYSIFG